MKTPKKLFFICLMLAIVFSCVSLIKVSAQDEEMTSQQIDRILANCSSAKNTLNQLHASDALLRVNMGQTYESMSAKLMSRFNSRVANNGYNNDNLVAVTNEFNSTLDKFRTDYKSYEEHLSGAINIDCKKQPVSFFDAISSARGERDRVHADVIKLNQYVDQYQLAVDQLEIDYFTPNNGTGQ